MKIGFIVGSLRKESWNRKVAEVAKGLFPEDFDVDFIEIADLPLYNRLQYIKNERRSVSTETIVHLELLCIFSSLASF